MNILIVTPRIPYPPYRGDKMRVFNLMVNLSSNNQIYLLTLIRDKKELMYVKYIESLGVKVEYVYLPIFCSVKNLLKNIFSKKPFQVAWFYSKKFGQKLQEITKNQDIDVIYYYTIRAAVYKDSVKNKKILQVIDLVDAISFYLSGFSSNLKNPIMKFLVGLEAKRVKSYENIASEFDLAFVTTERDKIILERSSVKAKIEILSMGVSENFLNVFVKDSGFDKNRILFTGNIPYWPNYYAILYFIREIFPIILNKIPSAKFYIVGQNPPRRLRKIKSDNIVVTGFVEDLASEYLKSAVLVAPIKFGSGISNKVIEALSLGVPVVCTSLIADGLPSELRKYLFVADNPKEFAELVIKVIEEPSIRINFVHEVRKRVIKAFDWKNIVNNFVKNIETEITKKRNL
ncbi:Glycosyltransferase involved in cell wall bisynthesis [Candidatus Thermokryptus mobilis]|uniref:Glycosyltransferase involved in cell wall bisynthesis n=2 Tax=Candidatus Thermokryptus mobilis TaxID=1643428 RepID=A0A0S4NE02_9BACT|nr:Glycosyltransferase involved in cell wall bisynthesis [Candidatus Thermokryptus mobilis]